MASDVPKKQVPSRLGRKGAGFACMQPSLAPMHTFAPNAMTGPIAPALEIYGVSRAANPANDIMGTRGTTTSQGASSLVMF